MKILKEMITEISLVFLMIKLIGHLISAFCRYLKLAVHCEWQRQVLRKAGTCGNFTATFEVCIENLKKTGIADLVAEFDFDDPGNYGRGIYQFGASPENN